MRRVLVAEPNGEIRWLLLRMVAAVGYEGVPHVCDARVAEVDAALVEPSLACAGEVAATLAVRHVPIIWLGTAAPPAMLRDLGTVTLVKPIGLDELRRHLRAVFAAT